MSDKQITRPTQGTERKKGILRLFEMMDRDGGKFFMAGLLALLGMIPYMLGVSLAVVGRELPMLIPAGLLGGAIASPQIFGAADTVLRSHRDEVGWWWWHTYKRVWKDNFRQVLAPGAVFGLLSAAQIYALYYLTVLDNPARQLLLLLGAALLELGILGYWLPMQACMELCASALLRNCFFLFFCHPLRSLLAALLQLVYWMLILTWFPMTLLVLPLTGVWLPMLLAYNILYPVLDRHFGLEEVYAQRRRDRWQGQEYPPEL